MDDWILWAIIGLATFLGVAWVLWDVRRTHRAQQALADQWRADAEARRRGRA